MPKDIELLELQKSISEALSPQAKKTDKKARARNITRIVAGKLMRFNRHGKAFLLENSKYGIKGPPAKEDRPEIEREWNIIKP